MTNGPRYSAEDARDALAASSSWSQALARLGMTSTGNNHRTLRKYAALWGLSTDHFDPELARRAAQLRRPLPLDQILVEDSAYSRGALKRRLYNAGLKERQCELCGQDETWRGRRMSLILDHVNGHARDHRLENLRIVCPNCAATLDTHCGRNIRRSRECARCGRDFHRRRPEQRYCSIACGAAGERVGGPRPHTRKIERPPYDQPMAEIEASSYLAVGRRYGVSDNAIRKWVRMYQRDGTQAPAAATEGSAGAGFVRSGDSQST